jgi:hypothetical protein
MTKQRFGKRLVLVAFAAMMSISASAAQQTAEPAAKAGKPINAGDILSGELNAYQITSEPRRLPPPNGLCNLETGPETFQLITSSDRQVAQLKKLAGKQVAVKVDEIACAQEAGQMSEAVIKKWSLVTTR